MNEHRCPICNKPTYVCFGKERKDGLCAEHGKMQHDGAILQCNHCGKWHKTEEPCECQKTETKNNSTEITCLICGEPCYPGKHFCIKCWKLYKEKEILVKINKCQTPTGEPLDSSYEGLYDCQDGHIVKSMAEQTIDDWLSDKGIHHAYEIPLTVNAEKPLHPDFCLKNFLGKDEDLYIEYFGRKGQPDYDKKTKYKIEKYKEKGITLICLYPNRNLKYTLQEKLIDNKHKIKLHEVNFEEK